MKSSVSARFNADLLEEQYALWCADSRSVDPTWSAFFEGFELGVAQLRPRGEAAGVPAANGAAVPVAEPTPSEGQLAFYGKVVSLVYNFRALGHTQAHINPLSGPERNPRLSIAQFGFTEQDMDKEASNPLFRDGAKVAAPG